MEGKNISFSMSEEQEMLRDTISKFIEDNILENAHDFDENKEIPSDLIQKFWELGTVVSSVPEEYGGYGMEYSPIMNSIILEELAFGDMAFAIAASLPATFINSILDMGTEEQKSKYVPMYCKEKYSACTVAINEPFFNFDPINMNTKAEKSGDSYVINGKKCFVPMAEQSGHFIVAAELNGKSNMFIVSKDNPHLNIVKKEKNLGLYSLDTFEIDLTDCSVPAEDLLGGEDGCDFEKFLDKSRIGMSAIATGVSRASFEYARDYSKERVQFGEPVASRQSVAFMIAEMAYEVDSMRLLTWKAASAIEAGAEAGRESYLAKLFAGDLTMKITDYGVQVLGGHGYIRDHPVERYYRNGRGIAIIEGMAIV